MKNFKSISDILSEISKINEEHSAKLVKLKEALFLAYANDERLTKFLESVENIVNPAYEFDSTGSLISVYPLPFDVDTYPYFDEYVNKGMLGYFDSKNNQLEVCHGEPITVNWNHGRHEFFVYDGDTQKSIIYSSKEVSTTLEVQALIEQYQRSTGCFGDVVEIDSNGSYLKHFEVSAEIRNLSDDELKHFLSVFNNNLSEDDLNRFVSEVTKRLNDED